jgi:hypothetical protein
LSFIATSQVAIAPDPIIAVTAQKCLFDGAVGLYVRSQAGLVPGITIG